MHYEKWQIKNTIEKFYSSLTSENKKDYLTLFSDLQIQIEGWFRGELMNYLKNEKLEMTVSSREIRVNNEKRKKVDLRVKINNEFYLIELKHILVGCQLNNTYPLGFYFYKNSYIYNDIEKLQEVDNSDKQQHRYSLAFISTNYSCDKCKNQNFKKINSKKDLKDQYEAVKEKKTDIEQNVSSVSYDYDYITHFGYLLLEVKINNENVKVRRENRSYSILGDLRHVIDILLNYSNS